MDPKVLKQLRKAKRLTQKELADYLHVSKSAVSQYERGLIHPHRDILEELAKLFSVSMDYLNGISPFQSIEAQMNERYTEDIAVCDVMKMVLEIDHTHRSTITDVLKAILALQTAVPEQNERKV